MIVRHSAISDRAIVDLDGQEAWVIVAALQIWLNGEVSPPDDPPLPGSSRAVEGIIIALEPLAAPPGSARQVMLSMLRERRKT